MLGKILICLGFACYCLSCYIVLGVLGILAFVSLRKKISVFTNTIPLPKLLLFSFLLDQIIAFATNLLPMNF